MGHFCTNKAQRILSGRNENGESSTRTTRVDLEKLKIIIGTTIAIFLHRQTPIIKLSTNCGEGQWLKNQLSLRIMSSYHALLNDYLSIILSAVTLSLCITEKQISVSSILTSTLMSLSWSLSISSTSMRSLCTSIIFSSLLSIILTTML